MSRSMQVQQQYTVEQEMQLMYMYDDFNNVVGVANETQAVLEYFKDDPEHPMVNINLNRLILQANISNGVHMDQQEEANGQLLQGTRKDLKQLYEKVMGNPAQYDERITNILKSYLKNLEPVMQLHQLQPLPTKTAEFNQGVVQKLVDGMSLMDNQVQKIRNGERYQKKTAQEIKAINNKRKEIAQTKLSANFPKQQSIIKSLIKQESAIHQNNQISSSIYSDRSGIILNNQQNSKNADNNILNQSQLTNDNHSKMSDSKFQSDFSFQQRDQQNNKKQNNQTLGNQPENNVDYQSQYSQISGRSNKQPPINQTDNQVNNEFAYSNNSQYSKISINTNSKSKIENNLANESYESRFIQQEGYKKNMTQSTISQRAKMVNSTQSEKYIDNSNSTRQSQKNPINIQNQIQEDFQNKSSYQIEDPNKRQQTNQSQIIQEQYSHKKNNNQKSSSLGRQKQKNQSQDKDKDRKVEEKKIKKVNENENQSNQKNKSRDQCVCNLF